MTIKAVIIPVCIGVLLFLGLLFILQRSLLFPRHLVPDVAQHPDLPEWVEQLWVTDGTVNVESWFLKGKDVRSDSPVRWSSLLMGTARSSTMLSMHSSLI